MPTTSISYLLMASKIQKWKWLLESMNSVGYYVVMHAFEAVMCNLALIKINCCSEWQLWSQGEWINRNVSQGSSPGLWVIAEDIEEGVEAGFELPGSKYVGEMGNVALPPVWERA